MKEKLFTTLKAWPIITIVTIAICLLTTEISKAAGFSLHEQALLETVRQHIGWNSTFLTILLEVVILAPLWEEAFFRGLLFKLPGPSNAIAAALGSSVCFAAAHYLAMPWPDNAFAALFFFGMAQCWLYRQTDSLFCVILNHALFNATNLVLLFTLPDFG
ncbi:MAG: CPBP family intramembrane metalloprotease [Kiritimatiellae bacterium]|nr:CPBP family intramembrane metalloprotease [Kiritimatiellia bacterium]